MRGEIAAAISDFQRARETTSRLAQRDPQNKMLQSDMCSFDFDRGRALTIRGTQVKDFRYFSNRSSASTICTWKPTPGGHRRVGIMIAEALFRTHHLPEALKHYQNAATALAAT